MTASEPTEVTETIDPTETAPPPDELATSAEPVTPAEGRDPTPPDSTPPDPDHEPVPARVWALPAHFVLRPTGPAQIASVELRLTAEYDDDRWGRVIRRSQPPAERVASLREKAAELEEVRRYRALAPQITDAKVRRARAVAMLEKLAAERTLLETDPVPGLAEKLRENAAAAEAAREERRAADDDLKELEPLAPALRQAAEQDVKMLVRKEFSGWAQDLQEAKDKAQLALSAAMSQSMEEFYTASTAVLMWPGPQAVAQTLVAEVLRSGPG